MTPSFEPLPEHAQACTTPCPARPPVDRQLKPTLSRRDIARLQGVAHAAVSRSFGPLVASACVAASGRTVDILDTAALQAAARSTFALQALTKRDADRARLHRVPALP